MDKLYVLDASGYLYRAYFAIKQMTNSKGDSTNALFGFIRSVLKLRKDFNPDYLVAIFDGPNNALKRKEIYPEYKGHRAEMPGDLLYQMDWARQFCELAGIPSLSIPDVEADDTMGAIAKWGEGRGSEVFLCTSDKDMCQLVSSKVFILNTHKENLILGIPQVEAQFGVPPSKIIDYLAIMGDSSDNVPGIPGFGPKTASELLKSFGSLDYLLDHPYEVPGKKKQDTLVEHKEKALMSRRLVTIDLDVPIPHEIDFYKLSLPQLSNLKAFYSSMDFHTLTRELDQGQPKSEEPSDVTYTLVDDEEALNNLVEVLQQQKQICFHVETTSGQPLLAELVGIGLGYGPKNAWYIPVNGHLGLDKVLGALKPLFENPHLGFYGHNVKYDYHVLSNYGIRIATLAFDTMLVSYLLNSHRRQHSLDYLALEYFGKVMIALDGLIGKGKKQVTVREVPIDKVCEYCCENIDYTVRLKLLLEKELEERKLAPLFNDLELPLLKVLAKMERSGIYVDLPYLNTFAKEVAAAIHHIEQEIYTMAGEEFNLNSPKQMSQILFEKMGMKPPRKTATGHSTDADTLEILQLEYPIAGKIMEYRTLEKLRSTYIDTLPSQVNFSTQRIHCTFNQSVAATGRLSCQDPNLQNIPIRTEIGSRLREAFRPQKEGWFYLAADYSQIELRLLAHFCEDPTMLNAFQQNEDIHRHTAAQIFSIPLDQVTREQRHQAKAVNFGVIYGQQAFGLARELGIDVKQAAAFIEMYFNRYNRVKEYVEACKESARQSGKAITYMGRERLIPDINSKNGQIRSVGERLAVNTPLQGTAADLIKKAMLQLDEKISKLNMKGFMILQIHDELIFELPAEEMEQMQKIVKETMEGVLSLKVPLVVDITIGKNWKEC